LIPKIHITNPPRPAAMSKPRVFVDTNVLLDIVLHRTRHVRDAMTLMKLGMDGRVELVTTASVIHAVRYVAMRDRGRACIELLDTLMRNLTLIPESMDALRGGLSYKDPEDAALAISCLEQGIQWLATRNVADFAAFQERGLRPVLPSVICARIMI
jgi:predicted nucleic acid-binding protein